MSNFMSNTSLISVGDVKIFSNYSLAISPIIRVKTRLNIADGI